MQKYETYGFANVKEMLKDAYENKYAIPALNFITIEQLNAIMDSIIEKNSPTIIMVAPKHCRQFEVEVIVRLAQAGIERIRKAGCNAPVGLHLDHGNNFEECKMAIDAGFSSVMIDGSKLNLKGNIELTKQVVEYAKDFGVTVEGELGALSGFEDLEEKHEEEKVDNIFTNPKEAKYFVENTGVDCLAVSVGTVHGLHKDLIGERKFNGLRNDIIEEISELLPGVPLVLHGCSNLPQEYVKMFKEYGGKIEETIGVPDECIKEASKTAVCKINIASDGWITSTAVTRKVLVEHPEEIDNRLYRAEIRKALVPIYNNKMEICGSVNKSK